MRYLDEPARDMRRATRAFYERSGRGGLSPCGIFGITLGVVAVGLLVRSLPDLYRYIKISAM